MKKTTKVFLCFVGAVIIFGGDHCKAGSLTKVNPNAPGLSRVNQAFLNEDFKGMTSAMKQTLMDHPKDEIIKNKIYSLLNRTYEELGKLGLPTEQKLPPTIKNLTISIKRRNSDNPKFSIMMSGESRDEQAVEQIKLTHYPKDVVIDMKANIGEFESSWVKTHRKDFYGETKQAYEKIAPGLYLIHMDLKGSDPYDGWIIITPDLSSSGDSEVFEPKQDAVIKGDRLELKWKSFTSPEHKAFEGRSIGMSVSRSEPPNYDYSELWTMYGASAQKTEVKVYEEGMGAKTFEPGHYIASISFHEQRIFGDIVLRRTSSTTRKFTVEK